LSSDERAVHEKEEHVESCIEKSIHVSDELLLSMFAAHKTLHIFVIHLFDNLILLALARQKRRCSSRPLARFTELPVLRYGFVLDASLNFGQWKRVPT